MPAERTSELAKEKKRLQLIYDSVSFFKNKMAKNVRELEIVTASVCNGYRMDVDEWQKEVVSGAERFDETAYLAGQHS